MTFFYTLTGGTRKQKEKKKFFLLKCIHKSNVIFEKNWALVSSLMYLVSVDPMDRSNLTQKILNFYILLLQLNHDMIVLKQKGNQRPINLKTFYKVEGLITWKLGNSASFEWRKDHGIITGNVVELQSFFKNHTHFKDFKIIPKVQYDYDNCRAKFKTPCPYYIAALTSIIMPSSLALLTFLYIFPCSCSCSTCHSCCSCCLIQGNIMYTVRTRVSIYFRGHSTTKVCFIKMDTIHIGGNRRYVD